MNYKRHFSELEYSAKISCVYRLLFLLFVEQLVNYFSYSLGISLSIFPLFWYIFVKKYWALPTSYLLFILGMLIYSCFSYLNVFFIIFAFTVAYFVARLFDFDKLSALTLLFAQTAISATFDHEFSSQQMLVNLLPHILIIAFLDLDIVPTQMQKKETIFS